jgi:hypothetical protein
VRVLEGSRRFRFGQKPPPEPLVRSQFWHQQLQRDVALQSRIVGSVDDAHAAAAAKGFDPVAEEPSPDHGI